MYRERAIIFCFPSSIPKNNSSLTGQCGRKNLFLGMDKRQVKTCIPRVVFCLINCRSQWLQTHVKHKSYSLSNGFYNKRSERLELPPHDAVSCLTCTLVSEPVSVLTVSSLATRGCHHIGCHGNEWWKYKQQVFCRFAFGRIYVVQETMKNSLSSLVKRECLKSLQESPAGWGYQ